MKNLKIHVLSVALVFCSIITSAQKNTSVEKNRINEPEINRPALFQNLPSDIPVNSEKLIGILDYKVGQAVNINLGSGFQFQGNVVSTASKYENTIQSIVIASTNYNGARLTLSKLSHTNEDVTFTGRIISFQHGDLFELTTRGSQYHLVRKKFYDLVNE